MVLKHALRAGVAAALALIAVPWPSAPSRAAGPPVYLTDWDPAKRNAFYAQDQGSRLMKLAWLRALKTADGRPFLFDGLARYGYLPNPASAQGLPVGFAVGGKAGAPWVGMSCAACHTREIDVAGQSYRIDGGPALTDFQAFFTDTVTAVGRVSTDDAAFAGFAGAVLGPSASARARADLRADVALWYKRESTMVANALPRPDLWGLGRLDAISMIFNRLSGLDVGPEPDWVIAANIQPADAPTRYPFIWNAPRQDKTQWPGIADNGDNLLAMARNLGEVYGVFARFHPVPDRFGPARGLFLLHNSADFAGLARAENYVAAIKPPTWPWPVDATLKARGEAIYAAQCAGCHAARPGKPRLGNVNTWQTQLIDVGTDAREYAVLARTARTGTLKGSRIPIIGPTLGDTATVVDMLKVSVVDALLQGGIVLAGPALLDQRHYPKDWARLTGELKGMYDRQRALAPSHAYESRVMHGIWAAAPYLHNGSVPTLADLLEPASKRPESFAVGRNYDIARVGLAKDQPGAYTRATTLDCANPTSGNSRCGHEGRGFGTDLSNGDKAALLEYMKTL